MSIDGTHDDLDVDDDYVNHAMTTMILLCGASAGNGSCLQYAWLAILDAAGLHAEAHDVLPP